MTKFIFLGFKITVDVAAAMKLKTTYSLEGKLWQRQCIKKQIYHFVDKSQYSQSYGLSSSHVWMRELDHKEGWALKNWCFHIVVLDTTLESPLDCKKSKPINNQGNQLWKFIGRTDVEAETPILWPPDVKSQLIWKDPDTGKDWRQMEKREAEDEMLR